MNERIEELVRKHGMSRSGNQPMRRALAELAAGYEERIAIEQRTCNKLAHDHGFLLAEREHLQERIRQLEEGLDYAEWAIAPRYSTSVMDEAGAEAASLEGFDRFKAETVWDAMLAAAQQPKKEGE